MKFRFRRPTEDVRVPAPPPKYDPFWRGDDGKAMEQSWYAVKIASQKVDPK